MRYSVKINRQASHDLTEIFQYIEDREQSTTPAEKFTNALVDVAMGLAQFPYRGHVINGRKPDASCTVALTPAKHAEHVKGKPQKDLIQIPKMKRSADYAGSTDSMG